uniref:Uncharacterized protein n=1 Tax=Cuerna arida TaxID=1464854 RepID=A0A1B6FSX6_9HEMI
MLTTPTINAIGLDDVYNWTLYDIMLLRYYVSSYGQSPQQSLITNWSRRTLFSLALVLVLAQAMMCALASQHRMSGSLFRAQYLTSSCTSRGGESLSEAKYLEASTNSRLPPVSTRTRTGTRSRVRYSFHLGWRVPELLLC